MMYQSRTGLMSHKHLTYYYFLLCTSRCMSHMHLISHKHLTCTVAAAVSVPCQKSRVLFLVVHFKMHEPHAPHQPQTPHLYSGSGRVRTLSGLRCFVGAVPGRSASLTRSTGLALSSARRCLSQLCVCVCVRVCACVCVHVYACEYAFLVHRP